MANFLLQDVSILPHLPKNPSNVLSFNHYEVTDFVEDILAADSLDKIHNLCRKLILSLGYDTFAHATKDVKKSQTPIHLILDKVDPWFEHYVNQEYTAIDPLLIRCSQTILPVVWSAHKKDGDFYHIKSPVLNDAMEYDRKNIIIVSSRSITGEYGGLRLAKVGGSVLSDSDIADTLPLLSMVEPFIHEAVRKNLLASHEEPLIKITAREQEILKWVAIGKDSYTISRLLRISENTVLSHMKKIHKKMNVHSRTHAVAKAISLGLITL